MVSSNKCLAVAALSLSVACGGGDGNSAKNPDAAPAADAALAASTAVYTPPSPGAGAAWGVLPFPNDLYLDDDGFLTLTSLPVGETYDDDVYASLLETLHDLDGAGNWTNVYFPIEGDIDPETLQGNVVLVDLDDGLNELESEVVWREDLGMIVLAPAWGTVLLQQHRYAAYLTNGVKNNEGVSIAPAATFTAAADLSTTPTDPALAAAQESLQPLLEALPEATVSSLVGATVFRTATLGGPLLAMRDIVTATPPTVTVTHVETDPTVIAGVQDADAPPGYSYLGPRAQPTSHIGAVVQGTIALANFNHEDSQGAGFFEYDDDGAPIVKGTDDVAFTLVLPKGESYANLPVMIFQHGMNSTRARVMIVGDIAAAKGLATLAIDLPFHGSRADNARDLTNVFTGEATADGFGDPIGLLAIIRYMHISAASGIAAYHPRAMSANGKRATINIVSLVSYVRGGTPAPINTALAAAALPGDLSFDQSSVGLWARSLAGFAGGVALAIEPGISTAVLDLANAGAVFPSAPHSPVFGELMMGVFYNPLGVLDQIEVGDPVKGARFHPATVLWHYAMQDADELSFAPYMLDGTLRGGDKPSLLLTSVYGDEYSPNSAQLNHACALDLPIVNVSLTTPWPSPPSPSVELDELTAPVSGNLGPTQTAGIVLIREATHGLSTWYEDLSEWEPEYPPAVEREEPLAITNPIVEAQTMITTFIYEGIKSDGAPTIVDAFAN